MLRSAMVSYARKLLAQACVKTSLRLPGTIEVVLPRSGEAMTNHEDIMS